MRNIHLNTCYMKKIDVKDNVQNQTKKTCSMKIFSPIPIRIRPPKISARPPNRRPTRLPIRYPCCGDNKGHNADKQDGKVDVRLDDGKTDADCQCVDAGRDPLGEQVSGRTDFDLALGIFGP
jgi:hypothetical protein